MTEKLVTVATFMLAHEAHLARTLLESEDIWAFVADDHINSLAPFLIPMTGGIKLQVRGADAARAKEILDRLEDSELPPPEPPV